MSDKNKAGVDIPPPPQQQRHGSTDENSLDEVPGPGEHSPFSSGRPPLAPPQGGQGPAPPLGSGTSPVRRPEAVHDRLQSAGEFSFLSALTDDDGERPNHLHDTRSSSFIRHNRAVSFDKHVMDQFNLSGNSSPAVPPPPPETILQPVLPDGQMRRPSDPLSPIGSSNLEYNSSTSGNRPFSAAVDNLVKQVNPVESEAEIAIMKAIEQAEDEMHRSQALPLKHLPDEALDLYETVSSPSQQQTPGTVSPTSRSSRKHISEDNSSHPSIAPAPSLEKPSHRRGRSTFSMANRNRSESIEATLFDLTNAMRDVHTAANEAAIPGGHRRGPSSLPFGDTGQLQPPVQNIPENSAEALAQHAQVLFHRNNYTPEDASTASGSHTGDTDPLERPGLIRGKSRVRLFSHESIKDAKKTDEKMEEHMGVVEEADEFAEELSDYPGRAASAGDIEHGVPLSQNDNRKSRKGIRHSFARAVRRAKRGAKEDWQFFSAFMNPLQSSIIAYCRIAMLYIMLPMIAVAAILFYGTSNPLLKKSGASISWLILFLVRQIVTVSIAKASELILIDLVSLRSRLTVRVFGPTLTLFLVQAKGFPFILFVWGIFSLILNSGDHRFARHWLYYQNLIGMFNEDNPSGDIPASETNYRVIASIMVVSLVVAIKRVLIGLYLGKRTLTHYGDQLAKVIQKMVLVSEVAQLSHDYEYEQPSSSKGRSVAGGGRKSQTFSIAPIHGFEASGDKFDEDDTKSLDNSRRLADHMSKTGSVKVIDEERRDARTGSLTQSQRIKMMQLLDDWEEPATVSRRQKAITINAILQFRQALAFMDNAYPFSYSFGYAGSREACIESAQRVYQRLMRITPDAVKLPFDTIGSLATSPDGGIDHKKMRALIKTFRPDRDGNLTMLDFVRSCDSVYKDVKVLRASIANSGKIDNASETFFNVIFYAIFLCIMLAANGINPLALFLSFSSVLLAFAWMIGSASAKMFEGIIFILVQRPYDIGDIVAIGGANSDSAFHGAIPWFVLNVDLFTTTIKYAPTGEVATISNGALANSRIINGARSPAPINHIFMKFSVDVPYSKVVLFHKTIEQFVKERPREWVTMHQFRATRVVPEQGFIEYVIVVQHRERWQNLGTVLMSQSDLSSYVLEVAKQLDMHYHAPAMPVELTVKDKKGAVDGSSISDALAASQDQDERLRVLSSSMFGHRRAAAT